MNIFGGNSFMNQYNKAKMNQQAQIGSLRGIHREAARARAPNRCCSLLRW